MNIYNSQWNQTIFHVYSKNKKHSKLTRSYINFRFETLVDCEPVEPVEYLESLECVESLQPVEPLEQVEQVEPVEPIYLIKPMNL